VCDTIQKVNVISNIDISDQFANFIGGINGCSIGNIRL
jgi:hypothetical protein